MTNVARTDVEWTNVAWANVAWANVAWTNGSGPHVNSQGWFHKLEMASTVLSLGGWGDGWGNVQINANSVSCATNPKSFYLYSSETRSSDEYQY